VIKVLGGTLIFLSSGLSAGILVAFLFDSHLVERQAQVMGYGREQLQRLAIMTAAAAQDFAIDSQLDQGAHLLLLEPLTDDPGYGGGSDLIEHPLKGRIARRIVAPVVLVGRAA